MADSKVDHLLLQYFDNIRYATDYRVLTIVENQDWWTALIDQDLGSRLFVPFCDERVEHPQADLPQLVAWLPAPSWSPGTMHVEIYAREVATELGASRARRVGYDTMPPQLLGILQAILPDIEFVSIATELFRAREEKHPAEVALLRASSQAAATAADAAMMRLEPGLLDFDVLAIALESMQRQGCEYATHSVCNVRRPSLEWFANGTEIRTTDAFFFDIGCLGKGGYASDICRTAFVGEPVREVARGYEILLDAYRTAQERARAGVRVSLIHEATNEVLTKNGLPRTPYAVGHGVGLRACEWPTIYRQEMTSMDAQLQIDSVIALEPETFVEVEGQTVVLKIEDNFVVREHGLELLSSTDATR
jgi:Xaa-Pro aminopeptidase